MLHHKEMICTLGPASYNEKVISRLENLGVDLFRINLSHTKYADAERVIHDIRRSTSVPICLDTEGAQVRTGDLKAGKISVDDGTIIRIADHALPGDEESFNLYPCDVVNQLQVGDMMSIDFNSVFMQVIATDGKSRVVRVITGGVIGQNKAVTVDRDIQMPALTDKDLKIIELGLKMGLRHVALSFANRGEDVDLLRSIVGDKVFLISKIETVSGIENLAAIVARSNAILIDRGDLSREVSIEQIPRAQKMIIRRTKEYGAKAYVATNFLESMLTNREPTRAEINDIFNTLVDGADGVVLAAETAIGAHPVQSATVVAKVIQQFEKFSRGEKFGTTELKTQTSFLLPEPHGGLLIDRMEENSDFAEIARYKKLVVDVQTLSDAEQIAMGTYSPLDGFMTEEALISVTEHYRLPNGVIWPLPIVLQTSCTNADSLAVGDKVALCLKGDETIYATMAIEEIYRPNLDTIAKKIFLSTDDAHPGVKFFKGRGEVFIAGPIRVIQRLPAAHKYFEITPRQARKIFDNKGWTRVVGFHTRNVAHRVHEYIQLAALEANYCDGLFIHPLVGPKKQGDFSAQVILQSYEMILKKYYPEKRYFLAAFQSYPRYSGPREAVFTALCRKNFGCSHFIVGRDHSGVGNYYGPDAAHKLFTQLGPLGIQPIFFNEFGYSQKEKTYVEAKESDKDLINISGTEMRRMLRDKQMPPEWFMRKEVANFIIEEINRGKDVFLE